MLGGTFHIHVHAGPHLKPRPRGVDPLQATEQARHAGMRAVVFKEESEMSDGTAWLVNRHVPGCTVYG